MMYPPLDDLLERAENRYSLVVETAKRARQLVGGAPQLIPCNSDKPVTIAVNEINDGKVRYERASDK